MLAAEPDTKWGRDQPESKGSRYCVYHDLHTHNTNECQELRAVREGRIAVGPTTVTGATVEEEEGTQDAGKTMAHAKGGAINLARITGKTRLTRETGGISLAWIARKATQASLCCRRSQGETRAAIRTRGLGASRSHVLSPASWAEPRPQPRSASSNSLLVK